MRTRWNVTNASRSVTRILGYHSAGASGSHRTQVEHVVFASILTEATSATFTSYMGDHLRLHRGIKSVRIRSLPVPDVGQARATVSGRAAQDTNAPHREELVRVVLPSHAINHPKEQSPCNLFYRCFALGDLVKDISKRLRLSS